MCHDFTSGPLAFVEFEHEALGREQNRGDVAGAPVPAGGGHVDGGEVDGEPQGPGHTQGAARLGKTSPAAAMATSRRGHRPDKLMPGLLRRLERWGKGAPDL